MMRATTKRLSQNQVPRGLLFLLPATAALLLFTGLESWLLFLAMAMLLLWLGVNLIKLPPRSWPRRINAVHVVLLLFWLWLALTTLWSHAPAESLFRLWPATLFISVIWAYLLEPDPERFWRSASMIGAMVAGALAIISYYQVFVLMESARSVFVTRNSHAGFMNLALILVVSYAVRSHAPGSNPPRWFRPMMAMLALLLSFSIALSASRAGALSLLGGLGLVIAMSARQRMLKPALAWTGLFIAAFLLAQVMVVTGAETLAERSLFVVHDRLVIWSRAWEMLKETPWIGTGIGTYAFVWPPYKDPADPSSGYFVHNDYLQLWIETGVPGLALLLATGILLSLQYWKAANSKKCSKAAGIESTGLIAAIYATAAHSFVDFNFHVPVTMLGVGLVAGRLLRTAASTVKPEFSWTLAKNMGRGARISATAILALSLAYVVAYGLGDAFAKIGTRRAGQGELEAAQSAFRTAAVFGRINDRVLSGYADFLRQLLKQLPVSAGQEKKELFDITQLQLDRVERLNPLRWDSALIRARLYQDNPAIVGDDWLAISADTYRHALALNPWFYEARVELALLLLSTGDPGSAAQELWRGIHYAYAKTERLTRYYAFALAVHEKWGSREQVAAIREKLNDLEESLRNRGPVKDCPLPARLWRAC
jgi:O-antigen ligase